MTTYRNSLEGGETDVLLTVDNSGAGSGDAFGQITNTSGSASQARFHASAAAEGALGMRFVLTGTGNSARGYETSPGSRGGLEGIIRWPGAPSATTTVARIDNSSNSALCYLHARTESSGSFRVGNSSNGTISASAIAVPTPGTARWLRVGLYVTPHATTGRVELYLAELNGTSIGSYDSGATLSNVGSTTPERFRFGDATTSSGWTNLDWDSVMWGSIASGRHSWNQAVVGGPVTAEPGQPFTLDASDTIGTITGWSQISGPTVTLDTSTMTQPVGVAPWVYPGTTLVYRATETGGSTADQTVTVLPSQRITLLASGEYVPLERRVVL